MIANIASSYLPSLALDLGISYLSIFLDPSLTGTRLPLLEVAITIASLLTSE